MLINKNSTKLCNFIANHYNTKTYITVIVIERLTLSGPLVQYVCHCHLTLEVMVFITCNQHMDLLLFTKQANFTPFAMHVWHSW